MAACGFAAACVWGSHHLAVPGLARVAAKVCLSSPTLMHGQLGMLVVCCFCLPGKCIATRRSQLLQEGAVCDVVGLPVNVTMSAVHQLYCTLHIDITKKLII